MAFSSLSKQALDDLIRPSKRSDQTSFTYDSPFFVLKAVLKIGTQATVPLKQLVKGTCWEIVLK